MSSPSGLQRAGLGLALGLLAALAGGCSFTPVYGDRGPGTAIMAVSYGEPANRLDQIVLQELALRLGRNGGAADPRVQVSTASARRALTHTRTRAPRDQHEVTVTVSYSVTVDGRIVAIGNRAASAAFATSGQVLADEAARRDAEERAARAAAETVRLAILGALATS